MGSVAKIGILGPFLLESSMWIKNIQLKSTCDAIFIIIWHFLHFFSSLRKPADAAPPIWPADAAPPFQSRCSLPRKLRWTRWSRLIWIDLLPIPLDCRSLSIPLRRPRSSGPFSLLVIPLDCRILFILLLGPIYFQWYGSRQWFLLPCMLLY